MVCAIDMFLLNLESAATANGCSQALRLVAAGQAIIGRMPQTVFAHGKNLFEIAITVRVFIRLFFRLH